MDTTPPPRVALLIAGQVIGRGARHAAPALRALGQVGEALAAAAAGWRVTRLDPQGGARTISSAANAVRELRAVAREAPAVAVIVATGSIVLLADGEPALLADARFSEASVMGSAEGVIPLASLRDLPRAAHVVLVVAGWAVDPPARDAAARWLAVAATRRPGDLVVVGAEADALATLEALARGLAGTARDAATGELTLASLAAQLARDVPGLAIAAATEPATVTGAARSGEAAARSSEPAAPAAADEDLTGTTLPGGFRLDARLARGGFGTVYRAHQLTVARDVAVKVLHADLDAASRHGALFVQEIQSVGKIDHPNVVRIHHADTTAQGRLFFAMELLGGRDLEQVLEAEGPLPAARAIALVRQLLRGLAAAHDADLVHADIKPANALIMTGRDGERVVLVDFGLARLRMAEAPSRSVGGTPAYMAPEQLRDGQVDARSDVFSAALVLVTLLTGWRRRTRDELVPPLDAAALADPALRATLARALAIDPAARFQSARELEAALGELAITPGADSPSTATATPPHAPPTAGAASLSAAALSSTEARRWRRGAVVAGGLLAVAGVLTALALRSGGAPDPRPSPAPAPPAASSTTVVPTFPDRPTVMLGGSGTLLWGFFAPIESFLEVNGKLIIPITSQNDVGSGGALNALRAGTLDVALLSRRAAADTLADARAAGKLLIEVAIGFDETSLFVWRGNPVRTLDLAAVRASVCCRAGEPPRPVTWRALGVPDPALADQPVTWLAFGRRPGVARETTSATLALADDWLCAPDRLCASAIASETQADQVLSALVKDSSALALSSRSFATDQVAAVQVVDRAHHTRLDGRKALWMYALVDATAPVPAKLCRFFGVVLDPSVARRLAAVGKATGLPDAARVRQRAALGLDDGACARLPASELAARAGIAAATNRLASPIAADVEVETRWVAEPAVSPGAARDP